jgi:hypothetical protein
MSEDPGDSKKHAEVRKLIARWVRCGADLAVAGSWAGGVRGVGNSCARVV